MWWAMAIGAACVGMVANVGRLVLVDSGMLAPAAAVISCVVVGVLGAWLGPRLRVPRVTISVPAVVIMVPGVAAYRSVYHLVDGDTVRVDGLDSELLNDFINELGWEALLNTRGTTWRKLDETTRNKITDAASAAALMTEMPAIIKRPLLCVPGKPMLLGFSDSSYQQFFHEV